MYEAVVGVLMVSVAAAGGAPAVGAGNSAPLVDAGLDQETDVGSTVRLDATGSRDPDGSITAYEWRIEAPNGTVREPNCPSCGRTTFRPTRIGTYEATVTVTDDDGSARSDTLYVDVGAGEGPTVSLSGPTTPTVDESASYTATVAAGDVAVDRVAWYTGGERRAETSADTGANTREFDFGSASRTNVTVEVVDVAGQTANGSLTVNPEPATEASSTGDSVGNDDDDNPGGRYIPQTQTWIRGDGTDTEQEAVDYALNGGLALDPNNRGGLNSDSVHDVDRVSSSGTTTNGAEKQSNDFGIL